jgi:general secretion pathway protein E
MKHFAEKFGIEVLEDIDQYTFIKEKIAIIPYQFAKEKKILPLDQDQNFVKVAVEDICDLDALDDLRLYFKKEIIPIYASQEIILKAIETCYHQKEEETKKLFSNVESEIEKEESNTSLEGYDLLENENVSPVIRMVNAIFIESIQQGASDIHFEPTEEGLHIRYRIDGCLQNRYTPSKEYQSQILTRIKVMAKMDIAENRLPQDGRIKLKIGGREIDFRVSTLPIVHGERIVLRILDKGNVLLGLNRIGMNQDTIQKFRKLIQSPEGIVLVTGPTGSGKTTTLYSAISELNDAETNIITVEDPVEYKIAGISQMNVNPKIELDFAKGLRHILRQDPDVIMIGEIRDRETAEIAIQASLTGHLVLSTLHTNDAPSALTRLADMGIEPYLLASSILGVIAGRLVRQVCPHCKMSYTPSEKELLDLNLTRQENLVFYKGLGCEICFQTGYKGRHPIYELMIVSSQLKSQVMQSQDAQELKNVALQEGMKTLFEEGVDLVLKGITTSSELLRVTKIDQG